MVFIDLEVLRICSDLGYLELKGNIKICFTQGLVLYVGPSGFAEMILFFMMLKNKLVCRYFLGLHICRTWAILHKEEDRDTIVAACRALESTAMEIFARHVWQFRNRLCF